MRKHHANARFALSADLHDAARELAPAAKIATILSSFARTARSQCAYPFRTQSSIPRFLVTRTAAATEVDIELAPLRGRDVDHPAGFAFRRIRLRLSADAGAVAAQVCRALPEAGSR